MPQCDFCHSTNPTWRWRCRSFSMPDLSWASNGDWAACDECNALVLAGRWFALAERCVATYPGFHLLSYFDAQIIKLLVLKQHRCFRQNLLAPTPERIENV